MDTKDMESYRKYLKYYVTDKNIPIGLCTGEKDIDGVEIKTGDMVSLVGGSCIKAMIGVGDSSQLLIYIMKLEGHTEADSVSLKLDKHNIERYGIRVFK